MIFFFNAIWFFKMPSVKHQHMRPQFKSLIQKTPSYVIMQSSNHFLLLLVWRRLETSSRPSVCQVGVISANYIEDTIMDFIKNHSISRKLLNSKFLGCYFHKRILHRNHANHQERGNYRSYKNKTKITFKFEIYPLFRRRNLIKDSKANHRVLLYIILILFIDFLF